MTPPLGPQAVPGQARVGNLKGQKDMQAHQANLSVSADEHAEGQGVTDGDRPGQRLTYGRWRGYWLVGVDHDRWSWVLHWCKWRIGACLLLSQKPETMDGVDVEL
jgi:hypothetical protein